MNESVNPGSDASPARKPVVIILALLLLGGVGALVAHFAGKSHPDAATNSDPGVTTPADTSTASTPVSDPDFTPPPTPPVVSSTASATTRVVPAVTPPPQAQVSPYARQIVTALAQLNMTNGPMTPEKLAAWKSTMQMLTNQGPAALGAIREFLASKQDMNFDSIGGSSVMGQPSMRLALIDSLFAMGNPDANALAAEAMRSSVDPREIALIARNLEQIAPGEFSQAALDAARTALAQARDGKISNVDVGALFDVLQRYGGADAVQDFQDAKGRWTYYSAIALSELPDGKGIPALLAMTQDGNSSYTRSAALQALAQWSESPEARNALLDQARTGALGAATWIKISAILGGEQFYIGSNGETGLPPIPGTPKSTYHLTSGNQNFYTLSVLDQLSAAQLNQRVQLIDQLLAANMTAAAKDALQRARSTLAGRLPQ